MSKFVKQLDAVFIHMFPYLQHSVNMLSRMFVYVASHVDIVGCGDQSCCSRVHQMMKLYLHVQIYGKAKIHTAEVASRVSVTIKLSEFYINEIQREGGAKSLKG